MTTQQWPDGATNGTDMTTSPKAIAEEALPEMPEPQALCGVFNGLDCEAYGDVRNFTEDQMRAHGLACFKAGAESAQASPAPQPAAEPWQPKRPLVNWVVERWQAEVANRSLVNVHRRTLDDTWRQVLRHLGADDVALLGPTHDDLLARASLAKGQS